MQVFSGLAWEFLGWHQEASGAGFIDCARGVAQMIEDYCRDIRPVRPFYCLAYNLDEGRTEVLTPEPVAPQQKELVTQTDAREAALASSAVPLFFFPRRVDRPGGAAHYVDGSTTEDVPLYSIVRKWDLDRAAGMEPRERLIILAVKLSSAQRSARIPPGRLGKFRLIQTVAAASQEAIYSRDLALIAGRPDVELVTLQLESVGDDLLEVHRIPEYIRAAKADFSEQLRSLERRLKPRTLTPLRSIRSR
jgi:predicted acylesterase/phospholipase RssA